MHRIFFIALIATACSFSNASENISFESLTNSIAKPTLVGMQLSIKKGVAQGKVPSGVGQCIYELPEQSFSEVVAAQLKANLSGDELKSAEAFFQSSVGQKYSRHGLIQLYLQLGEKAPLQLPSFSDTEYKEIEQFSKTSAGNKLMVQKFMEGPVARQALGGRIQQLLAQCRS